MTKSMTRIASVIFMIMLAILVGYFISYVFFTPTPPTLRCISAIILIPLIVVYILLFFATLRGEQFVVRVKLTQTDSDEEEEKEEDIAHP